MGQLVFQATLGGQVNLVGPNTASTFNINVPAVAGNMVTTGDTATVTNTMISGPVSIAKGGTNQTSYTSPAASVNGLVWFDGTSFQNDTSPAHVGYNSSTNTFNALNILSPNDASISGLTVGKGAGSVSTNTVVGAGALASGSQTGTNTTAIGGSALAANTSGDQNTAVGRYALPNNTTGSYGVAMGYGALIANTTGSSNTALGTTALYNNTTASSSTAVGYKAAYSSTVSTDAFGFQSLLSNTTGASNVSFGLNSSYSNTTGSYNSVFGQGAFFYNSTGANNTAVGYNALLNNTTASNNTAVGYQAGYSYNGGSGQNTNVGTQAGYSATSGYNNTFVGYYAGGAVTTGNKNTIIGLYSGNQGGLNITTSSNYIVLSDGDGNPNGYFDGSGYFYLGTNNRGIRIPSTGGTTYINAITSNSQFQLSYNSASAGVALASGATSWSSFSDLRLKNVTGTYENALADIAQIEPIKFTWKNDPNNKPCVGVSAQSVQNVVPEAIDSTTYEMDGDTEYLQVRYTELIPLMIASIKELKADLDATKAELATLKGA